MVVERPALKRLARRAGQDVSSYVLSHVPPETGSRFSEILDALREAEDHRFPLAELNDFHLDVGAISLERL